MSAGKEFPLSVTIRAVDQLTGPFRAITARLLPITKAFSGAGKDLSKFSEAVGFGKLFDGFTGVGGAVRNVANEAVGLGLRFAGMGVAAALAFYSIVSGSVEAGAELEKMSKRVGVGVNFYASLGYAANQAEVDQDSFNTAMDKFSKNLGAAKANGGSLLEFLQKVSPRLAEQFKGSKNAEQGLSLLTDAFKRLDDPQKRAILATEAFGKSGAQMGEFLHQGSAEIQRQQLEFLRLSGSQDEFAEGAAELNKITKQTGTAFAGLRNIVAAQFFPAFTKLAEGVTQFILDNRDGIVKWANESGAALKAWIDGGGVNRLIGGIRELAGQVTGFVEAIGGLKTVAIAAAALMAGPLIASVVALVPAFISLGTALLATPLGWFVLAAGAITVVAVEIYKNWDQVKGFFERFFPETTRDVKVLVGWFEKLLELWTKLDGIAGGNLGKNILYQATGGQAGTNLTADQEKAMQQQQQGPQASWGDALQTLKSLWDFRIGQPLGPTGPGSASAAQGKVQIDVNLSNLPRGTRVSQNTTGDAAVDVNAGYSGLAP